VPQSTFEPLPDDAWEAINEFYGLREDFPRKQLLLRNGASKVTTHAHTQSTLLFTYSLKNSCISGRVACRLSGCAACAMCHRW
jgi:hypothetical protein